MHDGTRKHRNIILKYLGRYVEQEPEATTKATTKEIEKPQSAAAKTTTTIGGRRKRTRSLLLCYFSNLEQSDTSMLKPS